MFKVRLLPEADKLKVGVMTLASDRSTVPALDSVMAPVLIWPLNESSCAAVSVSPPQKPVKFSRSVTVAPRR